MGSTPYITPSGIIFWIAYGVDHMSKQQMLVAIENNKAITVSRVVHRWICIYCVMDILQTDNRSDLKGLYFALATKLSTRIINRRPWTPLTEGLIEQSNGIVKTRINAWKRIHESTQLSECFDVSFYFSIYSLSSNFLYEVALQMNSTYHCAIEALPYKVVLNRKPRFERLHVANRHFNEADVEEYIFDYDQDDFLIFEDKEGL